MSDVKKEHLGGGVYAAPSLAKDEPFIVLTAAGFSAEGRGPIYLDELAWQRLVVYDVRAGFEMPKELVGP